MSKWLFNIIAIILLLAVVAVVPLTMRAYGPTDANNKAVAALENKEYDRAIELLSKAISEKPDSKLFRQNLVAAYNSKALSLEQTGKDAAAIDWYEKALKLDGKNGTIVRNLVSSLNNLAVTESNARRFPESQKYFEHASVYLDRLADEKVTGEIRHNYSALLTVWGVELMKRNRVDDARGAFRQSLDLDLANSVANIYIGDLCYEANQYDDARKHYSAAIPGTEKENQQYLKNRLQMIEEELKVEGLFKQTQDPQGHFNIQYVEYTGGTSVDQVMKMLSDARVQIGEKLKVHPARRVNVKIYRGEDFYRISRLPEWAIGIFDGKMRLKVDDVQSAPGQVRDLLFHEYTHAVLAMNVKQKVPAWFHEGLAQLMEPQFADSPREQAQMRDALVTRKLDFDSLQESFRDLEHKEDAETAYLLSKYFLLSLQQKYGHEKLVAWIKAMVEEKGFEESFEQTFGLSLSKAKDSWISSQVRD